MITPEWAGELDAGAGAGLSADQLDLEWIHRLVAPSGDAVFGELLAGVVQLTGASSAAIVTRVADRRRVVVATAPDRLVGGAEATIARFEVTGSGFTLEAASGLTRWRFAMGDDLPRPIWAGSREARVLCEQESVAEAFLLAHDCYLEV